MTFVIQSNMIREDQLRMIQAGIEGYPHVYVGCLPFSHEITSEQPLVGTQFVPYGSTSLVSAALALGWEGVYFDPLRFTYDAALAHRDDMLNAGVMTVAAAMDEMRAYDVERRWFMRPSADLKYFSGGVQTGREYLAWLESAVESSVSGVIDPSLLVVLDDVKPIDKEWRWFVVGGRIVSGSLYRLDGRTVRERVSDPTLLSVAQQLANQWLPHENCVMDTCLVNKSMKVVEFNCINGSGFYDHDVSEIMGALWRYATRRA